MNGAQPPRCPEIPPSELADCKAAGDYCPALFEWYKFVGLLANFVSCIRLESPALRTIEPMQFLVVKGLLNRISRLMFANVALSHEGRFGEATLIIDRCIFESATKVIWIIEGDSSERMRRYLADGLKSEVELRSIIQENIDERQGAKLPIEERMVRKIGNTIRASGLTEDDIVQAKKIPSMADILRAIGHSRLQYVVAMKVGSHAIHGTWPSLLSHFLEDDGRGGFQPRDADCETDFNQYVYVTFMVLDAIKTWTHWAITKPQDRALILDRCITSGDAIGELFEYSVTSKEAVLSGTLR